MQNEDFKNQIMSKLKKGEIKMTPRRFFIMKWATLAVTSLFFIAFSIYLFAYITFLFVDNGIMFIPLDNYTNLGKFIVEIPWTLVILGCLSVLLFSVTSKTFYRLYKKPFLSFFFSLIVLIIISQVLLEKFGIINAIKEEAYNSHIKLVPSKLLEFRDSQTRTLFVGYVVATATDGVIILDRWNNQIPVRFTEEDIRLIQGLKYYTKVNIFGNMQDGIVQEKKLEIVK